MAVIPQDQRGQIMLVLTVLSLAVLYFAYDSPIGSVPGLKQMSAQSDTLRNKIDSLENEVRTAQRAVASGTVQQLEQRLAEYQAQLDLMRQLVPASAEMANLFDDISSRAKVRGTEIATFNPQAVESGSPFDTRRIRYAVVGTYDQIGEFLSDIASLPRIIVPGDLRLERITSPVADTSLRANVQLLTASFEVRTYIKSQVDTAAARPAAQGAQRGGGQ